MATRPPRRQGERGRPAEQRTIGGKRVYDAAWRKVREAARARDDGLCQDCLERGVVRPGREGHHLKKVRDYPELRLDVDNVRMLCRECHEARTERGE